MSKSENQKMREAIAKSFGAMGIGGINFVDGQGKTVDHIDTVKPKSIRAKVYKHGGGMTYLKVGDKVKIYFVNGGKRKLEHDGSVEVVKAITKERSGDYCIALESGKFFNAGIGNSWRREFEHIK